MKTIIVHAKGKVQGVGYRKFCQAKALELNITGTAQNLADGSVEVYAQGSDIALKAFIDALKKGPSKAAVTHLEYQDISSRDFDQFKILV
ncbi:acylphosphatase [Helicobacter sp. 12S02634-8]|uniref:acylphosphatase n=1 Tax=Helicobacter sp. 12S02634-8 TaxID=1476199 RepID=UPI00209BCFA7|nr:acylphosphatase [Helicobacter sp. 12S02634-8]